ncbi:hypothetical protein N185_17540 [Sinorhizobium sp. GW3]|nr:hypothetical protein N185_17540 [Sinorhizobium sp. GW3]
MFRYHSRIVTILAVVALSSGTLAQAGPRLLTDDFNNYDKKYGLVTNGAFVKSKNALPASDAFNGTIQIEEGRMLSRPEVFKKDEVLGKDPHLFPAVSLTFITVGDDLVPESQDVILSGSRGNGKSFWDIIVQPGKVWSEPEDNGWSRASFPFSLVRSFEGETHNGIASFLYKSGTITGVRFQIVQQTSPFYVEDYFTASGLLHATYSNAAANADHVKERYLKARAAAEKILPWDELERQVGPEVLAGFNSSIRKEETVVEGISYQDKFYLKSCATVEGPLPYCDRQRFGVWSVTKSAATTTAMLRLAEKYGRDIFNEKISTYVAAARDKPGWKNVTFGDALNMATGVGYGSDEAKQDSIFEPFGDAYYRWYEAQSEAEKVTALIDSAKPYPWGPGKIARYRDEDMFILGVAMTEYLKSKEGPEADVWTFLSKEVFEPIGIYYAPTNKTVEADARPGQALMAFGFYPTISDLIKIARLYQTGGKFGGKQILDAEGVKDIMPAAELSGLNTGDAHMPMYKKGFWHAELKSRSGCSFSYAVMDGWGKNYVILFPHAVSAIRLAKNWDGDDGAARLDSITKVADGLTNLCQ